MSTSRLPVFQERFKSLRGELTQAQFSEKLGIARPTIALYESGKRVPDAEILREIAVKCNVSVDWLLGLCKHPTNDPDVKMLCEQTGLSPTAVNALCFSIIVAPNGRPTLQVSQFVDFLLSDLGFMEELMSPINDAINTSRPMAGSADVSEHIKQAELAGYLLMAPHEAKEFFIEQAVSYFRIVLKELVDDCFFEVCDNGEYQEN